MIIPAIDIRNGKCVRLTQGNYNKETVFDEDPIKIAKRWQSCGAKKIHIVDLDAAKQNNNNYEIIKKILESIKIPIQVGGGIRNITIAKEMINIGVEQIIFGTAAIEHPEEIHLSLKEFGDEKIIVGIDSQNGFIKTRGWINNTGIKIQEIVKKMENLGVKKFMFTDTLKDGTLHHPNFESIKKIRNLTKSHIIVAGGIADINDIIKLSNLGIQEVVVGMAIYTGAIDLKTSINTLEQKK